MVEILEKVKCPRPKCNGQITIPIKLVSKGPDIVDVAVCPSCHKKYKIFFNPNLEDEFAELFKDTLYYCDQCGTDNYGNYVEGETWEYDRRKIVVRCKGCCKKRAKEVTERILKKIEAQRQPEAETKKIPEQVTSEEPEPGSTELRKCPACGTMCDPKHLFCSSCGNKLLCPKCLNELKPGAQFCMFCGAEIT